MAMLGLEKIKALTETALNYSKADQTEIIISSGDYALSRFANNSIHQNVAETNTEIRVRVVLGKRIGVAEGNDLSADAIKRTVDTARAIAQLQPENKNFQGLPPPQPIPPVNAFVDATANFSPDARARVIDIFCRQARAKRLTAAGAFRTDARELAVANSLGTFAYHPQTIADLHVAMLADSGSGYAEAASPDAREFDAEALAQEAMDKASRARNPITLPPGEYTVLLEEYAVADLMDYLAFMSFNALAVQEARSFMAGNFGNRVMDEAVTIWDDGDAPNTFALPFDYEGVPKQRVNFIENGIARAVVYDSATANKEGKQSTGHSLPAPNSFGPLPQHMFLAPGDASREDLLRSVERGVLVTRFWYTRVVHPLRVVMTGMTRDGTFLIEKGAVTLPVKNLRFTTSYVDALANVRAIGRETKLLRHDWYSFSRRIPALVLDGFNFTGVTQ
jgi:PmbA protein